MFPWQLIFNILSGTPGYPQPATPGGYPNPYPISSKPQPSPQNPSPFVQPNPSPMGKCNSGIFDNLPLQTGFNIGYYNRAIGCCRAIG